MPRYFPTLPPELWELIIRDYNLYGLKYIKTINTIPSRHCIIDTVYCNLIQPYIDNLCQLIYSNMYLHTVKIISNPYIFNIKNLIDFICYITDNMKIDGYPKIVDHYGNIMISMGEYNEKILKVYIKFDSIVYCNSMPDHQCEKLHRIDGPAYITYYNGENKKTEEYFINDTRHRIDGPAYYVWYPNQSQGTTFRTGYSVASNSVASNSVASNSVASNSVASNSVASNSVASNSVASNQSGSNVVPTEPIGSKEPGTDLSQGTTFRSGNICTKQYFLNNETHRIDGPAYIKYYKNGNKHIEHYEINNRVHRIDGPSIIEWHENGVKSKEVYYLNNKIYRKKGPALIQWDEKGRIIEKKYYK